MPRLVQDIADFTGQAMNRERLLKKIRVIIEHPMVNSGDAATAVVNGRIACV